MFKLFNKKKKANKLYKIIFKTSWSSYDSRHTLLVAGNSPVDALESFYKQAGRDVKDILEFTEITYGSGINEKEMSGN